MAAQQAADAVKDAVQTVADGVQNMTTSENSGPEAGKLLDEVTGEYVSKTELKKRQKQREKEKVKAEKEATKKPPPPPKRKAGGAAEEEGELNANVSNDFSRIPLSHGRFNGIPGFKLRVYNMLWEAWVVGRGTATDNGAAIL